MEIISLSYQLLSTTNTLLNFNHYSLDLKDIQSDKNDCSKPSQGPCHLPWHVQNDPMLNWEPKNPFLYEWLLAMPKTLSKQHEIGQLAPTRLIRSKGKELRKYFTPIPQHQLIIHPAFAYQKGYEKTKGPPFPPYDIHVQVPQECPILSDKITLPKFLSCVKALQLRHYFSIVKMAKRQALSRDQVNANGKEHHVFQDWVRILDSEEFVKLHEDACTFIRESKATKSPHQYDTKLMPCLNFL